MDCSVPDSAILCSKNCSSGFGVWRNGSCACGTSGIDLSSPCYLNCSGRGSCANGTCACDSGYSGRGCEVQGMASAGQAIECAGNCSGHGSCVNGTCLCDHGWTMADCSAPMASSSTGCPRNCSGHGSCSVNNTCFCDPGYLGEDCSMHAASAPPCAMNCSNRGICVNSTCMCGPGYSGAWCEKLVMPGSTPLPDMDNTTEIPQEPVCPGHGCSGHGTCVNGVCMCDPFFSGEACDKASGSLISGCPGDCSQHGTCLNGTCMCDPMWDGVDCSYPSLCPGYSELYGANCSGHGACINGTCNCHANWGGVECSIAACPGKCSGHGICANGTCSCDLGWGGKQCNEPGCPDGCSGHGRCTFSIFVGQPTCSCDDGWAGAACSNPKCPTTQSDPYVACSGHGACYQGGKCLCDAKYAGDDCSILVDCNGRGVRKCGFCRCDEGFSGEECDVDVCSDSRIYNPRFLDDYRRSTVCNSRGSCTTARGCVCDEGWSGRNCSVASVCPGSNGQVCNGRGTCFGSRDDPGTCKCSTITIPNTPYTTPRFSGRYCEVEQCPGYRGLDDQGVPVECSGKGVCNPDKTCLCFNVEGVGQYKGIDCGEPPKFLVQDLRPKVGPLEGGTVVTILGPAIERFLPTVSAPSLVQPKDVYCDFGVSTRTLVSVGPAFDSITCVSPPVSQAGKVHLKLTDKDGVVFTAVDNTAQFEYFAQTRIIRINPSFGPLRPFGPLRGPSATNQNNTVTVTGTYFPPDGNYACRFGDCESLPRTTRRIDSATVVCEMPPLANPGKIPIQVSSNNQQYSITSGRTNTYSVYAVTSVSPRCASSAGVATVTVFGVELVDTEDKTRNVNRHFCRFGRVTLSGQTRSAGEAFAPGFKMYAFHTNAMVSVRAPGALECKAPNWPVEVNDFALTLDGRYIETNPLLQDGYYLGQWDSTSRVTFNTYYPPAVTLLAGPGNQVFPHPYLVEPTVGPSIGGTRVTIAGLGFDYARYGPESGNDIFAPWTPSLPNCNAPPIPSCRFGTTVTKKVEILNNETLVCITPSLPEEIPTAQTVAVQIALDGQSYSIDPIQFQFHPPHTVSSVFPTAGKRTGGTTVTVEGSNFLAAFPDGNGGSPRVTTCVFVSATNPAIRVKSTRTRFLTPERMTCVAPEVSSPGQYILDVSLSGQLENSQLSGSSLRYDFFQDPVISSLQDDIGTIYGGETVRVFGSFFLPFPSLACSFGDTSNPRPGKLVNGAIQCEAPPVASPRTVRLEITLNGVDWTVSNPPMLYSFYNLTSVTPSSGPAHGGTHIFVKIDGGPNFVHNKSNGFSRFVYRARIGDSQMVLLGSYDVRRDLIVFEPRRDGAGTLQPLAATRSNGTVDFQLALTTSDQFRTFPGFKFIIYTSQITSIVPCLELSCRDLALPKNGISYPITFKGLRLEDLDTIRCGYLPMNDTYRDAARMFRTFTAGAMPVMWYPGTYYPAEDALSCLSPPVADSSTLDGYYVTVALNGQNFDGVNFEDEVFNLMYIKQPDVIAISSSGGLASGGLALTVRASNWNFPQRLRDRQAPATLSCLFFLPLKGVFKFSQIRNPSCTGEVCTGLCDTPNFEKEADLPNSEGVLVKSQVFISLNRRDPCMRCGCNEDGIGSATGVTGFGRDTCSTLESGEDRVTKLSRTDPDSAGFCSFNYMVLANAFFCGPQGTRCSPAKDTAPSDTDDTAFDCLGTRAFKFFTFYQAPLIESIIPSNIGGFDVHNKTIPVVLAGQLFTGSQWAAWPDWPSTINQPVRIRATYRDVQTFVLVINGTFRHDQVTKGALRFNFPVPCLDNMEKNPALTPRPLTTAQRTSCYNSNRVILNQSLDRMVVSFEVSFNDGAQYTPSPYSISVYKYDRCPEAQDGGCGHGSCVEAGDLRSQTCFCGYWVDDDANCTLPYQANGLGLLQVNPTGSPPDTPRACKQHSLWYGIEPEGNIPEGPFSMPWMYRYFGKASMWPHQVAQRKSDHELGCSRGPQVNIASPLIGIMSGNTVVTLTLRVFNLLGDPAREVWSPKEEWTDFTVARSITTEEAQPYSAPRALDSYFKCFFGPPPHSPNVAAVRRSVFTDPQTRYDMATYECVAPPSLIEGVINLTVTYVNPRNKASPSFLRGVQPYRYAKLPTVSRLLMVVGDRVVPIDSTISVPTCAGTCPDVLGFEVIVEGQGFFPSPTLTCRINGVVTRARYISPTQMKCSLQDIRNTTLGAVTSQGKFAFSVSLNGQANEFVQTPEIEFFNQPQVVKDELLSFGVDPGLIGRPVSDILGTAPCQGSQCNSKQQEYPQLAPTTGNTPLVFYLKEPQGNSQVTLWSQRGTIRLRFGVCKPMCPPGTPEDKRFGASCNKAPSCTCNEGPVSIVNFSNTQSGGGASFQYYKMVSTTPAGVEPGRYMMCFSMNNMHYLPLEHARGKPFYFRFYRRPIITKLSITEGPIRIPFKNYTINISGVNFPVKTNDIDCDAVEVGLCEEYAPRIFVYFGARGSVAGGYGTFSHLSSIAYSSSNINVSSGNITLVMPDASVVSTSNFISNITVSFNGYDFTPVIKGVTEFSFYRLPSVTMGMLPEWGHYDATTEIVIRGEGFQSMPGRAMCRIASCPAGELSCGREGDVKTYVPVTFVSPTEIKCRMVPRPPSIVEDNAKAMYVSFTSDGRPSTQRDNPDMFEALVAPVGQFRFTDPIRRINISANAAPLRAGTPFSIVVIGHVGADRECFDMTKITTLRVGVIPTSAIWRQVKPVGALDYFTAPITARRYLVDVSLSGTVALKTCLMFINTTLPEIPYPMTADIKISLNDGQQFTGPTSTVLFYRSALPISNVPTRGSITAASRPQLYIYFDSALFENANPEFSQIQTVSAFAPTPQCQRRPILPTEFFTICALGPRCRFTIGEAVREVSGQFFYDPFRSSVLCTVPQFPVPGMATVSVTLDGPTFVTTPAIQFLFFDPPRVDFVLPTNGFWDARTNIIVSGKGFLSNEVNGTAHLIWCIFDFRDILPLEDIWDVPRRWTKAYTVPGANNTLVACTAPVIQDSERPSLVLPRARVGVIVDGLCLEEDEFGECIQLRNSDSVMFSNAFFMYTGMPRITRANPVASLSTGGNVQVTIAGTGFMSTYRQGPPLDWDRTVFPMGYRTAPLQKLCPNSSETSTSPSICPALSCRFGRHCPANGGECKDRVVDAYIDADSNVICTPPMFESGELATVDLAVSLNGKQNEFSNSLTFTYTSMRVTSLSPERGTAFGGGMVSVTGSQFVNITCPAGSTRDCLTCRFVSTSGVQKIIPAVYVSSTLVTCQVPPSSDFGLNEVTDIPPNCGSLCDLRVSVSVNGIEFVQANPVLTYKYMRVMYFTRFSPIAGPITGNTSVTVTGDGFTESTPVSCKFGDQVVLSRYIDTRTLICRAPPVQRATHGGVFIGFSFNGFDFCELVDEGVCQFTRATRPTRYPFFYHDVMSTRDISPAAGAIQGDTEVIIFGSGFADYGQQLYARFARDLEVPCTIMNATQLRCYSPAMPTTLQTAGGVNIYMENVPVPVAITSNRQQYTLEQTGQNCQPDPTIPNDDNPQAKCTLPFVMWSWFTLPTVTRISMQNGQDVPGFNSRLNGNQYAELFVRGANTLPQGPTSGGTVVVLEGRDFVSLSRIELINGPGVICKNKPAPVGESCTTVCTFPFRHSITGQQQLYYACTNVRRLADQAGYDPNEYWCTVHGQAPASFAGEYGICRYEIDTFRDFRQGGKVVTKLECLFGDTHVPATVIGNGTTISCISPPSKYGIVVPLSVTFNRRDYSLITPATYFQYISPAPLATMAMPDNIVSRITISFNMPTNRAGLQDPDGIVKAKDPSLSGCTVLFTDAFVAKLGRTAPTCRWMPGDQNLEISLTENPTFVISDVVEFRRKNCETTNTCWRDRNPEDLLSYPYVHPGCSYPKSSACNVASSQSYKPDWCGRCVPDPNVAVNELSYPFNMSNSSVRIRRPVSPAAPRPAINAFSFVDSCAKLCTAGSVVGQTCLTNADCGTNGMCEPGLVALDARSSSGNLGRAFTSVRWTADPAFPVTDAIRTQLNTLTGLVATVRSTGLPPPPVGTVQQYCFRLELTNWLNAVASIPNCFLVTRKSQPVASINLQGDTSRSVRMDEDLRIETNSRPSDCAPNTTQMTYVWDVSPMPTKWSSSLRFTTNGMSLRIPAFEVDFLPNIAYTFRLNATLVLGGASTDPPSMATKNIIVTFVESSPVAKIAGGAQRQIGARQVLQLVGNESYDPDVAPGLRKVSDLTYCWACNLGHESGPPCGWSNFTDMSHSFINLAPAHMVKEAVYVVSLMVAKASSGASCSMIRSGAVSLRGWASTTVAVSSAEILPKVNILTPGFTHVSASSIVRLSADIASGTCPEDERLQTMENCGVRSYSWGIAQETNGQQFMMSAMSGSGYGRITMAIAAGGLFRQDCFCYTFSLSVTDPSGATSVSSITIPFNGEPTSGVFTAVQSNANGLDYGFALTTRWTLTCENWADVDLPLQYEFFYAATSYTDAQEAISPPDTISLGPRQYSTTVSTVLPQGNLKDDYRMKLVAKIYDNLGVAKHVEAEVKIRNYPGSVSVEAYSGALHNQVKADLRSFNQSNDGVSALRYISIVGTVLGDYNLKATVHQDNVNGIRSTCLDALMGLFMSVSSRTQALARRVGLEATPTTPAFEDPANIKAMANSVVTVTSAPLSLETPTALNVINLVAQAADSGTPLSGTGASYDAAEEESTLEKLIFSLANTQQAIRDVQDDSWARLERSIRRLLITYMKGKPDTTFRRERNRMVVISKRLSKTVDARLKTELSLDEGTISPSAATPTLVKFNNMILSGITGLPADGVDYQVIAYNPDTNPLKRLQRPGQQVFSRVVSMNVVPALPAGSLVKPATVLDIPITNIPRDHQIELRLLTTGAPNRNRNATTGVMTATVCGFWNESGAVWNQFSQGYVINDQGGPLTCLTNHLTNFATVPGLVGCDFRASANPTMLNICEECGGGPPKKMQKICDWQAVPCKGDKKLDRCGVCGGKNMSFTSDDRRNESGVCDYLGNPCPFNAKLAEQEEPSVCGICTRPGLIRETQPNAGICDCQGTGVPNGGKVLDRCKICDGRNATMDYCGMNPNIPDILVCHTGGLDTTWNRSCTGCDGVPRPDLPWSQRVGNMPERVEGYGGVRADVCGICGGDGSNCTGCDGVLGSNARFDICGVCKGRDTTCLGCDGVPSKFPRQIDGCGICGGKNFGACDKGLVPIPCNYATFMPLHICKQGCDGIVNSGKKFDRCGVCGGDGTRCASIGSGINGEPCGETWTFVTGCGCGQTQDACGMCGGNGTTCRGCDGVPFSGKVIDACGICDGDNSSCLGCDGQVNSGKQFDMCGICDGGNADRDVCGICGGDGTSCMGCDGVIHRYSPSQL
jgi:hypothetical protein